MLDMLAGRWGLVLVRAALALIAGVLLLAWRDPGPDTFLRVFGIYALADGLAAGMLAVGARRASDASSLLLEAAIRSGGGLIAVAAPGLVAPSLSTWLGVWAGLSGLAQAAVAVSLRHEIAGDWPMPVAALLSLALATVCLGGWAADLPLLVWTVAGYCVLSFAVLMAFAYRMWQLACEMGKA